MIYTIILILLLAILIESLLQKWVNFIRSKYDKSYNWKKKNVITNIITEKLDKNPEYSKEEFFIHSFYLSDDLLGTNNKPNTYNNEIRYKKNQEILTKYSIDKIGSRKNDAVFKNSSNCLSLNASTLLTPAAIED